MPYVLDKGSGRRYERTWMSSEVNILDMSARRFIWNKDRFDFSAFHNTFVRQMLFSRHRLDLRSSRLKSEYCRLDLEVMLDVLLLSSRFDLSHGRNKTCHQSDDGAGG